MRISDWSSDVCSSDLKRHPPYESRRLRRVDRALSIHGVDVHRVAVSATQASSISQSSRQLPWLCASRSEEHTSELQSLMRISYAVFCLKKKKNNNIITTNKHRKTTHPNTEQKK